MSPLGLLPPSPLSLSCSKPRLEVETGNAPPFPDDERAAHRLDRFQGQRRADRQLSGDVLGGEAARRLRGFATALRSTDLSPLTSAADPVVRANLAAVPLLGDSATIMSLKPAQVFTPRNPEVNEAMYVPRPELEKALVRAVQGTQHVIVHGESGSGKSWLYKRVLRDSAVAVHVANLANASRLGSIVAELQNAVSELASPKKVAFTETKSAEVSAFGVAGGGLSHEADFTMPPKDPLEETFRLLRERAGEKACCLVLDNLETIFEADKLMSELGEIIVLLDDARYARHAIKLILVPSGVREYFSRTQNRATVTNRLVEIPEVASLTPEQVNWLVRTGFVGLLSYSCLETEMQKIVQAVRFLTMGIPQRVHELCLELAHLGEETESLDASMLDGAVRAWLSGSLTSVYSAIEAAMNERNTVAGRRNQILFALGQVQKDEFGYFEIEELVRREFPDSTQDKTLNISGLLSELAGRGDSLIKRSPKGDRYVFVDPKYRICLRAMLRKIDEKVDKIEIRQLNVALSTDSWTAWVGR